MSAPEISCVIPAYERLDLLMRCLTSVVAQRDVRAEIIVTDDSDTSRIGEFLASLTRSQPVVRYVAGPRTRNAVDNWNAGLEQARAPLNVLIHQDEFLVDPRYLRRAIDAINRTGSAAAKAGVAVIGVERRSRFALVAPIAERLWGAQRLLPIINWIGPTAAFVFRAGHRFDPTLLQLVDVEFYGRVLETGPMVRLPGVSVGSLGHHGDQITARIDPIGQALKEIALMAGRSPPSISPLAKVVFSFALRLKGGIR